MLMALTRSQFQSILEESVSIMNVTFKTFFLLLLTSSRRSEILAINISRTEKKDGGKDL